MHDTCVLYFRMSCHGCASKFTLFTKENSCPSCSFSYCSKCLKYKAVVPKLEGKECKICKSCYDAIIKKRSIPGSTREEYCPPESFLKRLESLENPSRPPITVYRQDSRIEKLKAGLNEMDREIVDRLQKLKEERKKQPVPTEEEVVRRLAMLKGEDPEHMAAVSANKKNYVPPDTRSSQEKADSLIQQYVEEKELEQQQPDPANEITQRLAKLRGLDTSSLPTAGAAAAGERKISNIETGNTIGDSEEYFDSETLDDVNALISQLGKELKQEIHEPKSMVKSMKLKLHNKKADQHEEDEPVDEEEVERTVGKVLEEVALEEKLDDDELEVSENEEKEEELPWCIICNETATIRCIDCDNDLYCNTCFKQGHDEWELKNHRSVPYKPKENPD